jgi:hypothetical protein
MLKTIQKYVVLWVQSKTGVTLVFLVAMTFAATAVLMMFVFLCVAAYAWASVELGPVFGGLATAGVFLLIALIGAAVSVVVRRQTRERAIVEQASRARTLLDPRAFHLAIQAGRALGWQRVVPLLLIGILGVQWARETHKDAGRSDGA